MTADAYFMYWKLFLINPKTIKNEELNVNKNMVYVPAKCDQNGRHQDPTFFQEFLMA